MHAAEAGAAQRPSRPRMGSVIVVIEGPSAAGKTTWCRRHAPTLIGEYEPDGQEPAPDDVLAEAAFWADVDCRRWQAAVDMERAHGTVVCDTDPLKLHYPWSLARTGHGDPARFTAAAMTTRAAVEQGRLGLADIHLVKIPSQAVLDRQRAADLTRRRHSFALHRLLAEPLREWYSALARLAPDRLVWHLPQNGIAGLPDVTGRPNRSDPALLDALLEALPPLPV